MHQRLKKTMVFGKKSLYLPTKHSQKGIKKSMYLKI